MKIKIGNYKNWFGPYQIAEMLCFWVSSVKDEYGFIRKPHWVHDFGTWLSGGEDKDSILMKICSWIDTKRKRKIKIHIDKWDTWNMDGTLSLIILPMLKQLKATKHGSPSFPVFDQTSNSAQGSFTFYAEGDDEAWETGHKQWEDIMDEMIWTFEQLQPDYDWEAQYWITRPEIDWAKYPEDEGKLTTPVRWKVEGECDWQGRLKHAERIQAGLNLFGEYYQNLWD